MILLRASNPFECFVDAVSDANFQKWFAVFISILMVCMLMDLGTGYMKAVVTKELSSKIGNKGLIKKIANMVAFLFGALIDICAIVFRGSFVNIFTIDCSFMCIIGGYIVANECISIIENLSKISPNIMPSWIKKFFKEVKNNIDDIGENKTK